MRSLLKLLALSLVLLSPCITGCSSQLSPEEAERLEEQQSGQDDENMEIPEGTAEEPDE